MTHVSGNEIVESEWRLTCNKIAACKDCRSHGLIHIASKPLFGRFTPRRGGVLFVFEAPNLTDTVDPKKGYLTYDCATDHTGQFTYQLITQVLGITSSAFQVTNAVLCLPAIKKDSYPVRPAQMRICSNNVRRQIETLNPLVVVSVGGKALAALRHIDDHGLRKLTSSVAQPCPWFGRWLFPLFHTSRKGRANRSADKQQDDWASLLAFIRVKGANLSS